MLLSYRQRGWINLAEALEILSDLVLIFCSGIERYLLNFSSAVQCGLISLGCLNASFLLQIDRIYDKFHMLLFILFVLAPY